MSEEGRDGQSNPRDQDDQSCIRETESKGYQLSTAEGRAETKAAASKSRKQPLQLNLHLEYLESEPLLLLILGQLTNHQPFRSSLTLHHNPINLPSSSSATPIIPNRPSHNLRPKSTHLIPSPHHLAQKPMAAPIRPPKTLSLLPPRCRLRNPRIVTPFIR